MEIMNITPEIIVAVGIFYFLAGLVDGIAGGGGLISLPGLLSVGVDAHMASGTNVCAALFGAITSVGRYIKEKKVYWKMAALGGPLAGIGAFWGARLNMAVPEATMHKIMLILLPIIAVIVMMKKDLGQVSRAEEYAKKQQILIGAAIGLLIGFYNGFYAAGAGTFYLLAFSFFGKLDLVRASGCARFCSLFATISAAMVFIISGAVIWELVICAAILNGIGNYIGAGLAIRKGAGMIRYVLIVMLVVLIGKMAVSYI